MTLCEVLLKLYRGSRERDAVRFPGFALALVGSLLVFDSAVWTIEAGDGELRCAHRLNQGAAFLSLWRKHAGSDPNLRALVQGEPGRTRRFADLPGSGVTSGVVREFCARFGIRHALCAAASDTPGGLEHRFCCYRGSGKNPFSDPEHRIARFLTPHLIEARRANLTAHIAACRDGGFRSGVCDRTGLIHHAEAGFRELLCREWPDLRASEVPARLLASLAARRAVFEGAFIIVKARRLGELLHVQARSQGRTARLSPRERLIAKYLMRGTPYKDIGRGLGITASTVTKHANSIYRKTGVRNRAQLAEFFRERGARSG